MRTTAPDICLRIRFCCVPECHALFFVCQRCDRGQQYCSQKCQQENRRKQKREANSRYQRTERGRLAHLLRQRMYRRKCAKASVTDHSCSQAISPTAKYPRLPTQCMVCCKENKWIDPFDQFSPRRWKKLARSLFGTSPNKYVFS
jgi:hypothetical protein